MASRGLEEGKSHRKLWQPQGQRICSPTNWQIGRMGKVFFVHCRQGGFEVERKIDRDMVYMLEMHAFLPVDSFR
jgi:hypothetical protein